MLQIMGKWGAPRGAATVVCERLEQRQLLAGQLSIYVDSLKPGDLVPAGNTPIYNIGTGVQGGPARSRTFFIKNNGDADLSFYLRVKLQGRLEITNPQSTLQGDASFGPHSLAAGKSLEFKAVLNNFGVFALDPANAHFTVTAGTLERQVRLAGQVIPGNGATAENWGSLDDGARKSDSAAIRALQQNDSAGGHITQKQDRTIKFSLLPGQSTVTLRLSGSLGQKATSGKLALVLVKDANGDGKMNVEEFEASDKVSLATTSLNNQAVEKTVSLSKSGYFLYLSAADIGPSGVEAELNANVTIDVTAIPPARIQVLGTNNTNIAKGDTTPATSDGTSFGSVAAGSDPRLSFTVKNAGGSTLEISGGRPDVTGHFKLVQGLNSTLAPNASAAFTVALVDKTTPGDRTGTITIKSSADGDETFTFRIGGKVTGAPTSTFATLSNGTLTVTGTSGNDVIMFRIRPEPPAKPTHLVVERNNVTTEFPLVQVNGIVVNAGDGNDTVSTTERKGVPAMTLRGEAGNDSLLGGRSNDLLDGGAGDDFLDGGWGSDIIIGGDNSDTVRYSRRSGQYSEPVEVTLDTKDIHNDGGAKDYYKDHITGVENIIGGDGNDLLVGTKGKNRLRGGPGNDTLIGGAGSDLLDGGDGDDVLYGFFNSAGAKGTDGPNTLLGGAGNDRLFARNSVADEINGGPGSDTLEERDPLDIVTNVENVK